MASADWAGVSAQEQRRIQLEAERAAKETEQNSVVTARADALKRLSGADLTASIDNAFLESYEPLRVDDNAAISAMHEAVSATSDVAQGMQNGTQDLLSAAESLSRRTEQQRRTSKRRKCRSRRLRRHGARR
jgi:methyl-accepting chemotaxis protein